MKLMIGNYSAPVIENRVYYMALENYPELADYEIKNVLDFINYETSYGREVEISYDNQSIESVIRKAMTEPEKYLNLIPDKFIYHASSLKSAKHILQSGKLLSAVHVYGKTGEELAYEKKDSIWNDPADYFEYIMFGWGNSQVGDYVVLSDGNYGEQMEEVFKEGEHTGIRFYFKYEDLMKHPGHAFDGYHAIKVKDEIELSQYLYACIVPEQYKEEIMPFIPETLKDRFVFLEQKGLGIYEWSEKVYDYLNRNEI